MKIQNLKIHRNCIIDATITRIMKVIKLIYLGKNRTENTTRIFNC